MNNSASVQPQKSAPGSGHGRRLLLAGADAASIRLALELADAGVPVTVCTAGALGPGSGGALGSPLYDEAPLLVALRNHPAVEALEQACITAIEQRDDGLAAIVSVRPQPVDPARCTACGKCVPVCPVELPSAPGLPTHRAVQLPPADFGVQVARIAKAGRAPCRTACPIGVNAQGYVALIAKGRHREALAVVRERNPLPGICGRVCTHPCEAACRRGEIDEPVAICKLKRYAADLEIAENARFHWPAPAVERAERIAVVGSGPAGLTAAYELRRLGYRPTIFEAQAFPGGLLRTGIPEYRLPRAILDYEIGLFADLGVEIRTGVRIGGDFTIEDLLDTQGFAAVVLATGAPKDRAAGIPGETIPGAQGALAFLAAVNLGGRSAIGKRVAVVGGGNSAIDAARVAIRLGAEAVTIVYRRGEEEMPALAEEIEAAREEGVTLRLLTNPVAVLEQNGRAAGLRCATMALGAPDASGRRRPEPVAGSEHTIEADTIVFAIGQEGDAALTAGVTGLVQQAGKIVVDERQRTGNPRVFAAGDVVRGPDSVIWSMADGQRAALAVHAALSGEAVVLPDWTSTDYDRTTALRDGIAKADRRRVPHAGDAQRRSSFDEVEFRFHEPDAIAEAARCLQCGICCDCGACVAACGEARAIDHAGRVRTLTLPLLAAVRTDTAETIRAGSEHLVADGAPVDATALLAHLHAAAHTALRARRRVLPVPLGVRVVLCTCNASVRHLDLVEELAASAADLIGVVGATVVNAACHPEGTATIAAELSADAVAGVVLAACLCCPLEILCGSCTHQRARAKRDLFAGHGLSPHVLETVNLRDEVLNQEGLGRDAALRLGKRALEIAVLRALSTRQILAADNQTPASGALPPRRTDRPAPLLLPGADLLSAWIDAPRCRGCGTCVTNCPQEAIALAPRPGGIPVARVDAGRCTLCGRCLAVCPTGAPQAPFAGHGQLRSTFMFSLPGAVS